MHEKTQSRVNMRDVSHAIFSSSVSFTWTNPAKTQQHII